MQKSSKEDILSRAETESEWNSVCKMRLKKLAGAGSFRDLWMIQRILRQIRRCNLVPANCYLSNDPFFYLVTSCMT